MVEIEEGQVWTSGDGYEMYVGRWSRLVATEFLSWLRAPTGASWLDVGCGTGALTSAILASSQPSSIQGVDPSEAFLGHARAVVRDDRAAFDIGDAAALPFADGSYGAVVSGLALNFVSEPSAALAEMRRVGTPGGVVAAYVWDYAGKMEMMRYFWVAAAELDRLAEAADEGARFAICRRDALADAFESAGLDRVEVDPIDVPTVFRDFDDFWNPFLAGQGPAPAYNMSLSDNQRTSLRELLRSRLPVERDGSIHLVARAWAARGHVPTARAS